MNHVVSQGLRIYDICRSEQFRLRTRTPLSRPSHVRRPPRILDRLVLLCLVLSSKSVSRRVRRSRRVILFAVSLTLSTEKFGAYSKSLILAISVLSAMKVGS